jgi:hypothetical protein
MTIGAHLARLIALAITLGKMVFWGLLATATFVLVVALVYALVEQRLRNAAGSIAAGTYTGDRNVTGKLLMLTGGGGAAIAWIVWAVSFDTGAASFVDQVKALFEGIDSGGKALLAAGVAGVIVFDVGAWMFLCSEQRTSPQPE